MHLLYDIVFLNHTGNLGSNPAIISIFDHLTAHALFQRQFIEFSFQIKLK